MFERASFGGHLHLDTNINQFWTRRRSARRLTKCIGLSYAGVSPPMGQLHHFLVRPTRGINRFQTF
jgi:hypothetical protein